MHGDLVAFIPVCLREPSQVSAAAIERESERVEKQDRVTCRYIR